MALMSFDVEHDLVRKVCNFSGSCSSRKGAHDMAAVDDFTAGGYRFIPGGFQFSGGVAAATGYEIKRFRFRWPVPLMEGFARIEKTIMGAGRPLTAFCAC